MNARLSAVLLVISVAVAAPANADPAASVSLETVPLAKSAVIQWENRSHETVDAKIIEGVDSIHLTHCTDITFTACDFRCIELTECTGITFRNCWIHDSAHCGVEMFGSKNVVVQGCRFENVATGVYAIECQQIQVIGNFCRNVHGPFPRGQLAQFDTVKGAGSVIRGNYAINDFGKSRPEDVINIYMSEGDKDSPILIEDNYCVGDLVQGSRGKSNSGSGIMLGDCGGAHQLCRRNVILSAGQVGIGVAGGSFITVEDNLIYGQRSDVSNCGLYAWNQSKKPSAHVTIIGNRALWTNAAGEATPWWRGDGISDLELRDNHFPDEALPASIPPPPSVAPTPPGLWTVTEKDGVVKARVPWPTSK